MLGWPRALLPFVALVGGIWAIAWLAGMMWPDPPAISIAEKERQITSRIREKISVRNGAVYITDPAYADGVYAYSLSSPWTVECDSAGLNVVFRAPADKDDAGVEIALLDDGQDHEACSQLVPIATAQVQRLIRSRS